MALTVAQAGSRLRRNRSTGGTAPPMVTNIQTVAAWTSLIKDLIDVFWKIATAALLFSAGLLFTYLRRIGWIDLFVESVGSLAGLTYLLFAAIALAAGALFAFGLPSLVMIGLNFGSSADQTLRRMSIPIYLGALAGWAGSVVALLVWNAGLIALVAFPAATSTATAIYCARRLSRVTPRLPISWTLLFKRVVEASFVMSLNLLSILLFSKWIKTSSSLSTSELLVLIGLLILFSFLAIVPGASYLSSRAKYSGHVRPLKAALVSGLFFVGAMSYYLLYLVPVGLGMLEFAGVFSNERSEFQVVEPKLIPALQRTGFAVVTEGGLARVSGFARYSFGGVRLLCASSLKMDGVSPLNLVKSNSIAVLTPATAGAQCVKTGSAELRRMTLSVLTGK